MWTLPEAATNQRRNSSSARASAAVLKGVLFCLVLLVGFAFPAARSDGQPAFVDVARELGLAFTHVGGSSAEKYIVETTGSGGGFLDYDNDGWLDIYLVNAGDAKAGPAPSVTNRLFRNSRKGGFIDVTQQAGVGDPSYGQGCAFGDYDNDGLVDIYVTNLGPNRLYRNNGDGSFTERGAEAGVDQPLWSTSAAFADYDQDGDLDLYVCNYLGFSVAQSRRCYIKGLPVYCYPHSYKGAPNVLYRNRGDGKFEDVTSEAGIREDPLYSKSLGVLWFDMDQDGDQDIYVANDSTGNYLFRNQGRGRFEDVSLTSGAAFSGAGVSQAGMGVDAADLDGSGRFHLIVTNFSFQPNALYRNLGGGTFSDSTTESGLSGPSFLPLGFGVNFLDFDNDGKTDLFVANGHVFDNAPLINPSLRYAQANQLFRQQAGNRFLNVSSQSGSYFSQENVSRGSAVGDFNNDGKVDLLVTNNNHKVDLLENRSSGDRQWLKFKLQGRHCNRDAVGAKVRVTAGESRWTQEVRAGSSYLSQGDLRLHFGLGGRTEVDSIQIQWPCGRKQDVSPPPLNRIVKISEEDEAQP